MSEDMSEEHVSSESSSEFSYDEYDQDSLDRQRAAAERAEDKKLRPDEPMTEFQVMTSQAGLKAMRAESEVKSRLAKSASKMDQITEEDDLVPVDIRSSIFGDRPQEPTKKVTKDRKRYQSRHLFSDLKTMDNWNPLAISPDAARLLYSVDWRPKKDILGPDPFNPDHHESIYELPEVTDLNLPLRRTLEDGWIYNGTMNQLRSTDEYIIKHGVFISKKMRAMIANEGRTIQSCSFLSLLEYRMLCHPLPDGPQMPPVSPLKLENSYSPLLDYYLPDSPEDWLPTIPPEHAHIFRSTVNKPRLKKLSARMLLKKKEPELTEIQKLALKGKSKEYIERVTEPPQILEPLHESEAVLKHKFTARWDPDIAGSYGTPERRDMQLWKVEQIRNAAKADPNLSYLEKVMEASWESDVGLDSAYRLGHELMNYEQDSVKTYQPKRKMSF
jgi:hypothetical protein